MGKKRRFIIGAVIIVAALAYLIYGGMQEALVYFSTPSELKQQNGVEDKFLRVGGMVLKGSLQKNVPTLTYRFQLTDGQASIPVYFKGVPPDLFREGTGAVVEGRFGKDGVFRATTIMAKHAEEYMPPKEDHSKIRSFVPSQEKQ
ncbi:MAG: cytochrome c maturation protein CcmE [Deltaproteobacteria bacterium]|nr:cytochrome c maturation protein CcmE [Deltaproteobacteria bacterium]